MSASSALWFLPFVAPICFWVAWNDMKFMKIPNKAVLALVGVFAIVGPLALPFDDYLWNWLHLVVILAIGFVVATLGLVGAGDAKFAAAMAPFIMLSDALLFGLLFSGVVLGAFVTHRTARAIPAVVRATPDWESWHRGKDFPMGLALGGALAIYLVLAALGGF